ncbi:hypothetical protein ONZ45_g8367 [Pleurotus djamor]|nr:hypothetical protein ONZ45_g8367 [Pleurotus djamor]
MAEPEYLRRTGYRIRIRGNIAKQLLFHIYPGGQIPSHMRRDCKLGKTHTYTMCNGRDNRADVGVMTFMCDCVSGRVGRGARFPPEKAARFSKFYDEIRWPEKKRNATKETEEGRGQVKQGVTADKRTVVVAKENDKKRKRPGERSVGGLRSKAALDAFAKRLRMDDGDDEVVITGYKLSDGRQWRKDDTSDEVVITKYKLSNGRQWLGVIEID